MSNQATKHHRLHGGRSGGPSRPACGSRVKTPGYAARKTGVTCKACRKAMKAVKAMKAAKASR